MSACSSITVQPAMARMRVVHVGFPNLRDNNWLYGGAPDVIEQTILNGRARRHAGLEAGAWR